MPVVNITRDMKQECYKFAYRIIHGNNQYDRIPAQVDVKIERTFVGKLAKYSFLYYLHNIGINYSAGNMFTIFREQ